jgi:hypothetical protein
MRFEHHPFIRRHHFAGIALSGLLGLVACTAPADAPSAPEPAIRMADEAGFEVLAELRPDPDTVVMFTREPSAGGGAAIGVTVVGADDGILYEQLITEQNATALELFLALAPESSVVPEALREAHRGETRAQGRADDRVRALDVTPILGVTAFPSVYCDSYTAFQNFVSSTWQDGSGFREQFTDSSSGAHFLQPSSADAAYLTACNHYSNRTDTKLVLLCSRYHYGDPTWTCDDIWLDDRSRVFKSWGCEFNGTYCLERDFYLSASLPDPAVTNSYLGIVQKHYVF